jgi:3'-phosphoadenosine 5'-phosphosulfate sulfotransferase (PAPS reductase)/FAD synthetase
MHTPTPSSTPLTMKPHRHILSLSGGKDSTALAIYMRDRIPDMEYMFCDTGEELAETKAYLDKLEAFLGKKVKRLNPDRPFTHYLKLYRQVLPDPQTRWCTRMLKIKPFEREVGDDRVFMYVGIRADEPHRKGYIVTSKSNIIPRCPFIDDNIRLADVNRILRESGIGLPDYYAWRSRSGCYFCFFQQRIEWVGLLENHPTLYWKAAEFEKIDLSTGEHFTWVEGESLKELAKPERVAEIKSQHKGKCADAGRLLKDALLKDVLARQTRCLQPDGQPSCH